jgi:enoyl-CoA hydratase
VSETHYQHLRYVHEDSVATLVLARPEARNALNRSLITDLRDALELIGADASVRAVILTGEGEVFCAGADLKERREHPGKDAEFRAPLLKFWHALAHLAKPLVIAVNGHAAGGGFELSLLGDAVVASDAAQFWLPEVQWGGIPGGWGTQLLPRLVGPVRARWIILNGHRIPAGEMLGMGLVTHVVPTSEVMNTARSIAAELAKRPPAAVAMAKEAVRQALSVPLMAGVEIEDRLLQLAVAAPERAGMLDRFAQGHRPK